MLRNSCSIDSFQLMALAAGKNRNGNFVGFGGSEKEHHMGRRFLQGFEQGVESGNAQHVDFIDDINFVTAVGRHVSMLSRSSLT
jgi:hypothetical protein